MSFNRCAVQNYVETLFPGPQGKPFIGLQKKTVENTTIDLVQAAEIQNQLDKDISSYYYKALLSYWESLPAIVNGNYSWATVRLYYSVFYATKTYLAINNVALIRGDRRMYYVRAKAGEHFTKCDDTTDHKASMLTLKKLYGKTDLLQSNTIDSEMTYQWLMEKREEVNYKDIDFHDPEAPDFWQKIKEDLDSISIGTLVDTLVLDKWSLCFQNEYGVLGIPTKRLLLTTNALRTSGKRLVIGEQKKEFIESFFSGVNELSQQSLVFWK